MSDTLIDRLVEEAKRVGKVPWCCSDAAEQAAFLKVNVRWPKIDYPQESFWETYDRWLKEGVITQEQYDKAKQSDIEWKRDSILLQARSAICDVADAGLFDQFVRENFGFKIETHDGVTYYHLFLKELNEL